MEKYRPIGWPEGVLFPAPTKEEVKKVMDGINEEGEEELLAWRKQVGGGNSETHHKTLKV